MNREYVCFMAHTWGKGADPETAVKQCRKHGGRGRRIVYRLPEGAHTAWVDGMGFLHWTWADDAPDRTAEVEVVENTAQRKRDAA